LSLHFIFLAFFKLTIGVVCYLSSTSVAQSLVFCAVSCRSRLAIVCSVSPRLTAYDYPLCIFKLFLEVQCIWCTVKPVL